MQGDSLHEISMSVFWEKLEKYCQFVICVICPERVVKVKEQQHKKHNLVKKKKKKKKIWNKVKKFKDIYRTCKR